MNSSGNAGSTECSGFFADCFRNNSSISHGHPPALAVDLSHRTQCLSISLRRLRMDGWYYSRNGQSVGPIPLAQLKQLAGSGEVSPEDQVWHPSLAGWTAAR